MKSGLTYLKTQPQTSSKVIFDSFQFANNKNDDIILYLFTCKFFEFWLVTSLPLFVFSKKNANQFEFFHQSESRPRLSTEFVLSYEFSLSQLHRLSCNLSSSTSLPISWSHKNNKVSTFRRKDWKWLWNRHSIRYGMFQTFCRFRLYLASSQRFKEEIKHQVKIEPVNKGSKNYKVEVMEENVYKGKKNI